MARKKYVHGGRNPTRRHRYGTVPGSVGGVEQVLLELKVAAGRILRRFCVLRELLADSLLLRHA